MCERTCAHLCELKLKNLQIYTSPTDTDVFQLMTPVGGSIALSVNNIKRIRVGILIEQKYFARTL